MNLVFLTNILNPYRINFFELIASLTKENHFVLHVVAMIGEKPNRPTWHYDELKKDYTILLKDKTIRIHGIYLHFNKEIGSTLKELQPDVVVCSGSFLQPSVLQTLRMRKKLGYKVYLWSESHLNEMRSYGKLLLGLREVVRKSILSRFDGFLYAGAYAKEYVDKYKNKSADLYLLHNTVDDHYFFETANALRSQRKKLRKKYGFLCSQFVFVSPIRLSPEKGLGTFLKNAEYISPEIKNKIVFAIAGIGPELEKWQQIADQTGFDVRFLGMKNQLEIVELYVSADCFFLPSTSDPNPLTVIEAAWTGLPLFVSKNVGNWPEIVKPGENGFVFDYNHPEKIEEMIEKLIAADETWRSKASLVTKNIMETEYQSDHVARLLVDHFKNIY